MFYNIIRTVCRKLPKPILKNIPVCFFHNKLYNDTYNFIKKSEYWTSNEWEYYQLKKIRQIVKHGYDTVPFYRKLYNDKCDGCPRIDTLRDIQKFPFLNKLDIKNNLEDLKSTALEKWRFMEAYTGGSTATALKFYIDGKYNSSKDKAYYQDAWDRIGYKVGKPTLYLKGRSVAKPEKNIFWAYIYPENYLNMSCDYLDKKHFDILLKEIINFSPKYVFSYPSACYQLMKLLKSRCIELDIKAIMLASENIPEYQRNELQDFFGCRVFSHYGHSEQVLIGAECEYSTNYHFYPQYGYLELIDMNDNPITEPNKLGEIVGTSLYNFAMPFIRYRTNDYGCWKVTKCKCSRNYPILDSLEGRLQEFIVTKDSRLVSICTMGAAHFRYLDNIEYTQYYQDTPGVFIFKVTSSKQISKDQLKTIKRDLEEKLDYSCDVRVIQVKKDDLKFTESNKKLMIEQKLDINKYI